MFRSNRLLNLFSAAVLVIAAMLIPEPAQASTILTSDLARDEVTQYWGGGEDGQAFAQSQHGKHYYIRFQKDDPFEMVLPQNLTGQSGSPFFSEGSTLYWYRPDAHGPLIPLWISNKVLKSRSALMGAKEYFDKVCEDAGIRQTWWEPDKPILVLFGSPSSLDAALASAGFWNHRINIRPDMSTSFRLGTILTHEYFHMVYDAVWFNGDKKEFNKKYWETSKDPYRHHMIEMTAEWATDEPVKIPDPIQGGVTNQDTVNDYLLERSRYAFNNNEVPFFDRDSYESNIFIKYLAEQMAGAWGADRSSAKELLEIIIRMYSDGGVTRETFFKHITDSLPGQYWPGEPKDVWMDFYTAFCATNLVQKASASEVRDQPLGYHDDAFQPLQDMCFVKSQFHQEESSKAPTQIFTEPAQNDDERQQRLETIMGADELVEPLAVKYHQLNFYGSKDKAPARPVFVYAKGTPETDVFFIRQRYDKSDFAYHRKSAKFRWDRDFTFRNQRSEKEPQDFLIYPDYSDEKERQELWIGLVNPSQSLQSKMISWAYMASPRLIPQEGRYFYPRSKTVGMIAGTARDRISADSFDNGDTFDLEINSTGPLHREGANVNDLAPEDLSVKLEVLSDDGDRPVFLSEVDGRKIKVKLTKAPTNYMYYYTYTFSGKFSENNTVIGSGRFKFKLTSPLNLGAGDEQVDESFKFKLQAVVPKVSAFRTEQAGKLVYDSGNFERIPVPENGSFDFDITIRFSIPMYEGSVRVTAGTDEPYNKYKLGNMKWSENGTVVQGKLQVPESDVPKSGALLKFAISGESQRGGSIDADLIAAGNQPDTSHFFLLGIQEFYDLDLSTKGKYEMAGEKYSAAIDVRSFDISLRLIQDMGPNGNEPNAYAHHFQGQLKYFETTQSSFQKFIGELEKEVGEFSKNKNGYAKQQQKETLERIKGMKRALASNQIKDREMRQRMKDTITKMEADFRNKSNVNPAEQFREKEQMLAEKKAHLKWLKDEIVPGMEAVTRMIVGLKSFLYQEKLSGPVSASFAGFSVEAQPNQGPYSENYSDYEGKMGEFEVRTAHANAPGWSTYDMTTVGASFHPNSIGPRLHVWNFDMEDFKKTRALVQVLAKSPVPQTEQADYSKVPPGGPDAVTYSMNMSLRHQIGQLPYQLGMILLETNKLLWEFFPEAQRPKDPLEGRQEQYVFNETDFKFPDLSVPGLFRVEYLNNLPRKFPVQFEGRTLYMTHSGYPDPRPYLHSAGTKVETNQGETFSLTRTVTSHIKDVGRGGVPGGTEFGHVEDETVRVKANLDWAGVEPPPVFFRFWQFERPLNFFHLDSRHLKDAKITVSGEDCKQDYDLYFNSGFLLNIYGECDQQIMAGTLTGRGKSELSSVDKLNVFWETRWRLERVSRDEKKAPVSKPVPAPAPASEPAPPAPKPEPEIAPAPKPERTLPSASAYDPDTRITTAVQGNPDGSRTVTKTDKDGKVISAERVPPPGERLPSGSSVDPYTGNKIEVQGNADGSRTVTRTDERGKVLSQEIIKP